MNFLIETERLILRNITHEDLEGFYELDSDPEVHRYLGNEPVTDRMVLAKVIDYVIGQYEEFGIGRWAVTEKITGEFAGWCGLKYIAEAAHHPNPYYDLGYRLIRRHWGKGYATEAARASLNYGFRQLDLNEIYAAAHPENEASNRILLKLGFSRLGSFMEHGSNNNWYVLKK
ncbi:MAG: GNAT family N-acetyltransferase [Saprospiraceae bacterium]|nr:GNAT family N-acetyltransferase [Saprospiraceae bacterium]HMW39241.1 GNAT family N-acetyltransferase [Saprospiraceae bacterium]HMX88943.1 GNAT family N-acetyltransferase [Saprospiraceae bacterium]HMZ40150.1 GNAT family N-acetyltransferase [Saprospiraceae bacterium]HNA64445.1 GNAT family N-acetyltransferase [Saprospiraceae bacterium]